jgi:transposase-like protein
MSAVNSGDPVAAASQICGIPPRTLRDWVHQKGSPLKKVEQNAVLPADAEKQLHERVIYLKKIILDLH